MSKEGFQVSDEDLVEKILNGNIQSFAIVVKDTEKLVTQIVRKMISNEDDQKDLVQEIYLRAYQSLSSFQFKSKLSTWIATIAYNRTIIHLQKKKIPITDITESRDEKFPIIENPESATIKSEEALILQTEIARLPPLYKTLITLYHLEELPTKEIAEITNLPDGTVKSYLFRARKILKDNISQHYSQSSS
ncbi:RNA polymerase sigma factor [Algoriphagus confluentis]|uniref:RNA polymerase sigma factor n=1 Tax=Algoriphagus confluentis TaxID=1697556 RepID=A0ABQ6PUS7_9BACT|nr:RNA polymerase sigma factor [Algoriphagus confluentis]